MDIEKRLACLHKIDLFDFMTDQEQQAFVEELPEFRLGAGDVLFKEEEPGHEMFILLSGRLKVQKNDRLITEIRAVDYIGEMAVIEELPRSATVVAESGCELLVIDRRMFERQLSDHPMGLISIMKSLSRKIRKDTELIAEEFTKANILIHDMRNQLTSFLFLDLLLRDMAGVPEKKYVERMITCRHNLAAMMEEAMDNALCLKQVYEKQTASITELIVDLVDNELRHHPDLADKKIRVVVKQPVPDLPFNQVGIRRVVTNLMINAGQASPVGGLIELVINFTDNRVIVACKDRGPGIAPELVEKVFRPHFTTRRNGTGLGLSSCKQIIEEKHGGSLNCTSRPDEETVFAFTLPLAGDF